MLIVEIYYSETFEKLCKVRCSSLQGLVDTIGTIADLPIHYCRIGGGKLYVYIKKNKKEMR